MLTTTHQITVKDIIGDLKQELICVASESGRKKLFFKPYPTHQAKYLVRDYKNYDDDDLEFFDLASAVEAYNKI